MKARKDKNERLLCIINIVHYLYSQMSCFRLRTGQTGKLPLIRTAPPRSVSRGSPPSSPGAKLPVLTPGRERRSRSRNPRLVRQRGQDLSAEADQVAKTSKKQAGSCRCTAILSFSKFNQSGGSLALPIRSQYVLTNGEVHQ